MHKSVFSKAFHIVCNLCGARRIRIPVGKWGFRICGRCDQAPQQ